MPNLNVNVAVTPVGTSIAQGVNFAFSPGVGMPSGVVSADGKIDLSKDYPSGTSVMLVFTLTTPTIQFTTGPSVGTFGLNFYSSTNGAKDALWIALQGQNPGIYNGTEFVFGPNALGPKSASLSVQDNNDDGLQYAYALWIWTALSVSSGQKFGDDPRLINHPRNR